MKGVRGDFPVIKNRGIIYFDNAATSLKPYSVIEAVNGYYKKDCANVHRGPHKMSREASEAYEEAHEKVASFFGKRSRKNVVFVRNTTEALNMVAHGLEFDKEDEILIDEMSHHSNMLPFRALTDAKVKYIKVKRNGKLDMADLKNKINNRTKLVVLTHVSNTLGTINPVEKISKLAHEHGAYLVVDGAQSAPHMPVDVEDLGIDFFGFSVTGDTPLLISSDGKRKLISIKEVIEKFKNGENVSVLTLDQKNKLSFAEIKDYLCHKAKIYEIKYGGCSIPIKTTADHSVFVWKEGEIVPKLVKNLESDDYLITFNKNLEFPTVPEVTLTYRHHDNQVEENVKITRGLMRLIGYYLAEGHLGEDEYKIAFSFNKKEEKYIKDVKNLIKKLKGTTFYKKSFKKVQELKGLSPSQISKKIGLAEKTIKKYLGLSENYSGVFKPKVRQMKVHNYTINSETVISFNSKKWFKFFKKFCGEKERKHLPSFVWNSSRNCILELLRGYLRGDGSKTDQYKTKARSTAKNIIKELCWLLKLKGISNTIGFTPRKGDWKETYDLNIQKSELKELSEFYRERIQRNAPKDKTLPVDKLREAYMLAEPKHNYKVYGIVRESDKRAPRKSIIKVIEWVRKTHKNPLDPHVSSILEKYETLLENGIGVVKVKKVKEAGEEKVYDISVSECERFFGGVYPILLHNSGHKMLGPTGIGGLVAEKHLLEKMKPTYYGGGMIKNVEFDSFKLGELPWKFEAGTPAIAQGIGLGAAVDYLNEIGMKKIRKHEKELLRYLIPKMREIENVEIYGPLDLEERGGLVTFNIGGLNCHDTALIFDKKANIALRSGGLCAEPIVTRYNEEGMVRASFYLYNTKNELDRFISLLNKVAGKGKEVLF